MHLLSRPSPSFKTQLRAAADGSEREYPIPIARNIAWYQYIPKTIKNLYLPILHLKINPFWGLSSLEHSKQWC